MSANLTVNLVVADASNADFVSSGNEGSQSVTIAAGVTTADFILSTEGDTTDEVYGAVGVVVRSGTGYTVGSPDTATVTVNDDDPTRVTLSVPDATATEGSSSGRATVRLALNRALRSGESLAIPLGFSGGVLGTDFSLSLSGSPTGVALSGSTVTFSGIGVVSATSADVLLSASEDVDAVDETVTVSIPSASSGTPPILTATFLDGGATGSRTGNGQIVLSDVTPTVSFAAATSTVAESGGTRNVALSISPAPTANITVNYTVSGSAGSSDFSISGSGTVTVAANATSVNIPVAITDDNAVEAAETVILTLNSGTGYAVGSTNVHTLTITDNDTPALVFSPTSLTAAEGASGAYTVRLATLPTGTVTVTVGGAGGDVTVDTNSGSPGNQNTLSFTTSTWNTAQTVMVAAGEDVDTTNDSATLSHSAAGGGYGSITGNVAVTVTDNDTANNAPTVATVIPDQPATAGTAFSYAFPANTFTDADNDTLNYSATQGDDSALPGWLTFTEASRTFSGTPQSADMGTLSVKVTADDSNGGTVSDTFNIVVSAAG
ncbi:MAG: putative Ig domain-containing protein [Gammaproteobacteria bacterium]|nr:putative Ig domain-containing protein [Gammaproteobacteria bacterium]